MTEPNVLGNVSPAKFLFDSGNTEIINLWSPSLDTTDQSAHYPDSGTVNGQNFLVPVSHSFYLLNLSIPICDTAGTFALQSNTSPDTATGGTTLLRRSIVATIANPDDQGHLNENCCVKFNAGEYVTLAETSGNNPNFFWLGWGVLCDA